MKLIKTYPGADVIITKLSRYHSEEARNVSFDISNDDKDIGHSIVLRENNVYPNRCGLIVISSKIDDKVKQRLGELVLFGLSNYSKQDIELIEKNKVRYFTMKKIMELGLQDSCDSAMESAINFKKLCISIDLDCLDSAFAEKGFPGGLSTRQLICVLQRFKQMKNLRTVEIAGDNTDIIAKIVKELG